MARVLSFCLFTSVVAALSAPAAAPPSGILPPAQAVIYEGNVWAVRSTHGAWALVAPLEGGDTKPVLVTFGMTSVDPARWHVSHRALWFTSTFSPFSPPSTLSCSDALFRREASLALRGKLVAAPGTAPIADDDFGYRDSFGDHFPATRFRWFGGSRLDRGLYYEFLPTGPASVLHFVLTEIDNDPDATAKVPWSLTVFAHSAKWDPKARTWAHIGPKP